MSENWARRERHTNHLVSKLADHVLAGPRVTARQLHGLCALTWVTKNHERDNAPYIKSTKLPALSNILGIATKNRSLSAVAAEVAFTLDDQKVEALVTGHSGITMYYSAFRNSSLDWLEGNRRAVTDIARMARRMQTDADALALAQKIERLPLIPKANNPDSEMLPQYLLTPLVFALDPRLRFPIVNGRDGVQALLSAKGVKGRDLVTQVATMVSMIGTPGINDAADLDDACGGGYLHKLVTRPGEVPTLSPLLTKPTEGQHLPVKDEADIEVVSKALSHGRRKLHNAMTNRLKNLFADWTLTEGLLPRARYDVLVHDFDGDKNDLLVEVKSSADDADVRMAIGQLFAYGHHLYGGDDFYRAIVLPTRPAEHILSLLDHLEVGCMWFDGPALAHLLTENVDLGHLASA